MNISNFCFILFNSKIFGEIVTSYNKSANLSAAKAKVVEATRHIKSKSCKKKIVTARRRV